MTNETKRLDEHRSQVRTLSVPASYVDTGGRGRPMLFGYGAGCGSHRWRHAIELPGG